MAQQGILMVLELWEWEKDVGHVGVPCMEMRVGKEMERETGDDRGRGRVKELAFSMVWELASYTELELEREWKQAAEQMTILEKLERVFGKMVFRNCSHL